ncbi:MAG: hypothetical protein HY958_11185 [Bacteroidia bacterium]|nr:hypothetical protein [Bacteroidia bacterium]
MSYSIKTVIIILIVELILTFQTNCFCQSNLKDTINVFKRGIPQKNKNNSEYQSYILKQAKVQQLKIDSLEDGYDSLEIRIWYNPSWSLYHYLFVLKFSNSIWAASIYKLEIKWNDRQLTEIIVDVQINNKIPKNGWSIFLSKFFELKINELSPPIPCYITTDGTGYDVEVASKKQYSFNSFQIPNNYKDYTQLKNLVTILKLIETEFGIESYLQ